MDTSFLYRTMTGQIGGGNSIGRNSGASNDNFFTKRAKSIENAFGTTGSALVGGINNLIEKGNAADREQKQKDNLDEIAKKYGFKDRYAVFDAAYEANEKGDKETADRLDKTVMAEFRGQAAADSKEAADAARNWQKYSNDSYISKKINQDQGKFAGSAINTLSTAVDLTGLSANPLANSIQGGIEGVADELEQNGFKDFSLERAGQNALIGAATGAATGALNKGLSNSLAKRGGNLFKGGNKLTQGLNTLGSKTALGRVGSTIATGAGRGAISGAVGGATGAGLSAAMNGGDIIGSAFEGAKQGIGQGAMTGGIMAGANLALSKTPGVGDFYNELQSARSRWDQSGSNFDERLTNTLTSGDSAVGDWLMGKTNSKALGSIGSIGDTIRDYTDQGMGIRKATDEAYRDLLREYAQDEEGGYEGLLQNAKAAGYPGENNYQSARRFLDGGGMDIYPEDMLESLRSVYGDDFKESIYKNKDGSWRIKNGEPYVETMYKNQLAQRIAKDLDAYDANDPNGYVPGSEKEGFVPGIGDAYETAVKARNARLNYLRSELENGRISYGELAELQNYKPQILASGDAQLAEAAGIPEDEFNAYNARQSATPAQDAYSQGKGSFSDALNEFIEQGGNIVRDQDGNMRLVKPGVDTPTTAKGWLKKAGERIVEDVNKTNLGNRIDDVSKKVSTRKLSNTIIDEGSAYAPKDTVKKFLLENRKYVANNPSDFDDYRDILDDFDGMVKRIDAIGDDNIYIEENPMATSGYHILPGEEARKSFSNIDAASQPKDLGGWLKKAGQRIVEDVNKSNLGNRIKTVNDEYSNDIRGMKINDWNEEPIEGEVIEAPRSQATRQLPARQVDAWDRLAQENGYNSYDEVIQRYMEANPNTPLNPRGAAGQILSWLDENPNTPTTARGWARQAVNRAAEDLNNSNLGMRIKDVSQDDPSKQLYNALTANRQPIAEAEVETEADMGIIPSKTSKESKLRYARGKELVAQYGTVDAPMARATNAVKTFQRIADMGFEDPTDVEFMANAITGSNGYVSTLNKNIIESAKPVDTFSGDGNQTLNDFIDNSIAVNKLSGLNEGVAVKRSIDAYLKSLPSRAEGSINYKDSAADTFKVVQGLEASAAELEGRGGSTYHRANTVDLHQAAVLKDVANLLKNRIYDGSNAKIAITPQVVKEMKALAPGNEKWSATVDNFAKNVKTPQDLRRFQEPFVKAGRYIDNQYVQAATVGGRMAANAGELPTVLRTTKAGIINDLVNRAWNSNMAHRGRAALYDKLADRAAEKAVDNPTTAKGWIKQAGQRAAEDLGKTNLGNRIQDVSGQPVNPQVATPAELANTVADYNPATQLYNAIGRTEGLSNIDQARTANYLNDAAQDMNAEAGYMPPLGVSTSTYGAPTTSTSVYDTMAGTASEPTATATAPASNNYFQPTGDYWTDTIARALTSAINADDVTAFASLYKMYQDALSKIQTASSDASSANSNQKITATQQRANAAMNSLGRISKMTPDLGYNLSNIPIIGDIATFGGNDYEAEAKSLAQQIGYMVSGANIKEEEAYNIGKAYVPQPWDSEQTRQNKLQRAYEIIQQYQNNYAV